MSLRFNYGISLAELRVGEAFTVGGHDAQMISIDHPDGSWIAATAPGGPAQLRDLAAKLLLAAERLEAAIAARQKERCAFFSWSPGGGAE